MKASVTNIVERRRQWAKKLVATGVTLFSLNQPAQARMNFGGSSESVFVQVPAISTSQNIYMQQVITPPQYSADQMNQLSHLWPRTVSFSLETDSIDPFVQADLTVGVQHNYNFNFELGAMDGLGGDVAVPTGWYQLQVAVIRQADALIDGRPMTSSLDRYITSTSTFVKIGRPNFGKRLSLQFPDVTTSAMKSHLFVELIPLQETCTVNRPNGPQRHFPCIRLNEKGVPTNPILIPRPGFKTYLYEMPIIPYLPNGNVIRNANDLREDEIAFMGGSLASYIAKAQIFAKRKWMANRRGASPLQHAQASLLTYLSINDPEFKDVQPLLRKLMEANAIGAIPATHDRAMYTALCNSLNKHQAQFWEANKYFKHDHQREMARRMQIEWCGKKPQDFLRITRIQHVGKAVPGPIKPIAQRSRGLSLMANSMKSRSSSVDVSTSVGLRAPGFFSQFLDMVGLGFSRSMSISDSRSQAESAIASLSDALDYNFAAYDIPVVNTQICLEVLPRNTSTTIFYNPTKGARNGLYICTERNPQITMIQESYIHVFERCKDTTLNQCNSLTQSTNFFKRGERDISGFFYDIQDALNPDADNQVTPFVDQTAAGAYFAAVPRTTTLEVVKPIEFPQVEIPTVLRLVPGMYSERF